jgi:hypothetical protein
MNSKSGNIHVHQEQEWNLGDDQGKILDAGVSLGITKILWSTGRR